MILRVGSAAAASYHGVVVPTDYVIDTEHRAVFTVACGALSILDLLDSMTRLLADPRFSPSFDHIADFRHVDTAAPQLSSADVRSLAARTVFDPSARRAFIIGSSSAFELAKVYAAQRDAGGESNIRMFHDLESAAAWAGVDVDTATKAIADLTARLAPST